MQLQDNGAGIALHVPADGRLNGDGFTATIVGYRFAYDVGLGSFAQVPSSGQVLLVFGVNSSETLIGTDNLGQTGPTASLVVDGQSAELPTEPYGAQGPIYYLVSVPAAAKDVALQLSLGGYGQTFSFTKGRREGPQPYVLYASQDNWELTDNNSQSAFVSTPDPTGHFEDAGIAVDISSASLSFFSPGDNPQTPPNPARAWLVLNGTAFAKVPPNDQADVPGFYFNYLGYLTGNDLLLTLPHHKPIPALLGDRGGSSDESSDGGVFGGTYYWPVPSSTRQATVQIEFPPKLPAESSFIGSPMTVPVRSAVKPMSFTFPAAYQPQASTAANPPPYAPKPTSTTGGPGRGHPASTATGPVGRKPSVAARASGATLTVLLIAIAVVGLGYALFALKYRRFLPSWITSRTMSAPEKRAQEATIWLRSQPGADGAPATEEAPASPTTIDGSAELPLVDTDPVAPARGSPAQAPSSTSSPRQYTSTVLIPIPSAPAPPAEGCVEVVLCAEMPTVIGWPTEVEPPTSSLLSLLAFLAWHEGQSFTGDNLRAKIGAGRPSELSVRTIGTYMNQLRRGLGPERVPEAGAGAGYRIVGIGTDARRLEDLVALAGSDPANSTEHLSNALSLLQGVPLSEVTSGPWGWANIAGESVTGAVADAVLDAATQLGRMAIGASHAKLAKWATDKGLLLWPQDWDLNKMALDAAWLSQEPSALPRAWNKLVRRFATPDDDEPTPDELQEHYQSLRRRPQHKDPPAP